MQNIVALLFILFFLAAGMLIGRSRLLRGSRAPELALDFSLYALLFTMGYRIGESDAIRTQIAEVGLISITSAVASIIGTALFVGTLSAFSRGRSPREAQRTQAPNGFRPMVHLKDPLRLFSAVIVGFFAGYLLPVVATTVIGVVATWLLYLLLFLIGFQLSRSEVSLKAALVHPRTLLLPAATVLGTLAGGAALAPLLSLPIGKELSVTAGFGWYSLSGVIITNLGDPVLGSAAFVSNMLREGISLMLIPLLGRSGLKEVAIGIAGATSMDVTLPLIRKSCGSSYVPLSVASGAILSFLVPILVPLLYRL